MRPPRRRVTKNATVNCSRRPRHFEGGKHGHPNSIGRAGQIRLVRSDVERSSRAEKFYAKVVGWSLAPNTMNAQKYTLLKAGDNMVGGLMPIPEDAAKMGVRPAWMGYIAVDDVQKYADKVKAAGGSIYKPPTEIPNVGTFAVAADPSGAGFLFFKGGEGGEAPMQEPTKPGYIGWHELHGGDPEKSFAFYSGLFGWTKGEALNMGAMGTYQIFSTKVRCPAA